MRKGQAAMEFLMTYGWAILVVLAAIAALAYFGVLSPDRFVPDKCVVQGKGVTCGEYGAYASSDQVQFEIQNSGGEDLTNVVVTLTPKGTGCVVNQTNITIANLPDGSSSLLAFDCTGGITGTKFRGDIVATFTPSGKTLPQTATGSISAKVQ